MCANPLGSVLPPYKTSRNSGGEPISFRLHTLMFTPGSEPTTWARRSTSISAVGGLSTWFNGKSRAATEGVKTTICLRNPGAARSAGTWKRWPLIRNLSLHQTWSQLSLPSQLFVLLFALLFLSSPRSHSRQHLPISEHFKRLRCCSYWFLCLGCGALGDFIKDEAPVVFLSKLPRSACQSEVHGARTRERIHTGRRNIYPRLCAKRHAKMKHKASFISKN